MSDSIYFICTKCGQNQPFFSYDHDDDKRSEECHDCVIFKILTAIDKKETVTPKEFIDMNSLINARLNSMKSYLDDLLLIVIEIEKGNALPKHVSLIAYPKFVDMFKSAGFCLLKLLKERLEYKIENYNKVEYKNYNTINEFFYNLLFRISN